VLALVAVAVAASFGPLALPVPAVLRELADRLPLVEVDSGLSALERGVLVDVRLPRVLLAFTVGAVLATSGASYQGVFRNPLADPYLLGVAAGAGLGATIALTGATSLGRPGALAPVLAFVGALVAVALAYVLGASVDRERTNASLILAGVAIAALLTAVQTFLLQRDDEAVRDVYSWLLGRFNTTGWNDLRTVAPYAAVSLLLLIPLGRRLDVLAVGDDEAQALGAHPRRTRLLVVAGASLGTAAAVAVSGLIGFVGIIVPHAIRITAGTSYRRILPLAALVGGAFLCLTDLAARTVLAPAEIPISVVTACVGAPSFLVILRHHQPAGP
jgi:iron complex transport system permease protein